MKRFFNVILCLLFLIIFLRPLIDNLFTYKETFDNEAFAQTGEIGITSEDPKTVSIPAEILAEPCKPLTVPVEIDEVAGIAGLELELSFDPEILISVNVERTSLSNDFFLAFNDLGDGLLKVAMAAYPGIGSGSGAFIKLIFDVSPDVILSPGSTEIAIEMAVLRNEKEVTIDSMVYENGEVIMPGIGMNLPEGWSLISLPAVPDDPEASALFPGAVVIYKYDRDKGYSRVTGEESLEIGRGYWIMLNEGQYFPINGQHIQSYKIPLYEDGWSMIGGCTCPAGAQMHNGKISVIYKYAQGTGYQRVPASGPMEPGQGFWILCQDITGEAELEVK